MENEPIQNLIIAIKEHKFLIITVIIFTFVKVVYKTQLPPLFFLVLIILLPLALFEMARSKYIFLKYVGWGILIYSGITWILTRDGMSIY